MSTETPNEQLDRIEEEIAEIRRTIDRLQGALTALNGVVETMVRHDLSGLP
jgi:prefoldin subunit 5